MAVILLTAVLLSPLEGIAIPDTARASGTVRLSHTKRSYFLHGVWDKLTLKGVSSGARIRWKSSDKKIVRIREHFSNGIWYQVKRDGKTTVTATYKGKRYRCRIRVKREVEEADPVVAPTPTPAEPSTPQATSTPIPTSKPSASPSPATSVDPYQHIYDEKIADFKARYITEDMSEYDKVDAICRYISYEYDYDAHIAGWFDMVVKGAGDCMASRIGVNRLCTELGIRSFVCGKLSDHGECMVRIDDDIYMTVTGFGGAKPREYRLYRMSETELAFYLDRYSPSRHFLGLE